jgi:uncharacterized membrane protein
MVISSTETKLRSLIKLLTFKITEVILSTLIIWIATHNFAYTLGLPILIEGVQALSIFFVERVWTRIDWGKSCNNCHYYQFHEKRKKEGKVHD